MDDVQRIDFQRSLLQVADQLEGIPFEKRRHVFDSMVAKAFTMDGGQFAHALHFNACLVTELRRRDLRV